MEGVVSFREAKGRAVLKSTSTKIMPFFVHMHRVSLIYPARTFNMLSTLLYKRVSYSKLMYQLCIVKQFFSAINEAMRKVCLVHTVPTIISHNQYNQRHQHETRCLQFAILSTKSNDNTNATALLIPTPCITMSNNAIFIIHVDSPRNQFTL